MNIYKKIILFVGASSLFVACTKDDATGYSTLVPTSGVVATINVPFANDLVVQEISEGVYTYTVSLSAAQAVPVDVIVTQTAGNATAGDDFSFDSTLTIPTGAKSVSGTIKILNDDIPEGTETFTLQIGNVQTANAVIVPKKVSFSISNGISTDLDLTFNYNKGFSISGTAYTLKDIKYDMDFYVLDKDLNDTGIYDAAGSANPEKLLVTPAVFPDGIYHIYYDIYSDGDPVALSAVYHDPFDIPVTVDYLRAGGITKGTFTEESKFVANSTDGKGTGPDSGYVVTIEIANGVYTLKNSVPEVIVTGKSANKVKLALAHARANNKKK